MDAIDDHAALRLSQTCIRLNELFWKWATGSGYTDCQRCRELGAWTQIAATLSTNRLYLSMQ
jgi:hypothetical protein